MVCGPEGNISDVYFSGGRIPLIFSVCFYTILVFLPPFWCARLFPPQLITNIYIRRSLRSVRFGILQRESVKMCVTRSAARLQWRQFVCC